MPRLKLDPSWEKGLLSSVWCATGPTALKVDEGRADGKEVVRQASLLVAEGNSARNMTMCCNNGVEMEQQRSAITDAV